MKGLLLVFFISYCLAACPNLCSGHGTCSRSGSCICYPGWTEGDCSARTCPYDNPYVQPEIEDAKTEATPNKSGDDRSYLECSGQGECDRTSGLCQCYPGYEGTACQRQACPNGCSGHGVCTPIKFLDINEKSQVSMNYEFLASWKNANNDVEGKYSYIHWDQEQSFACLCDSEYEGYDCNQKKCPTGYFPTSDCDAPAQYTETITFTIANGKHSESMAYLEYKDQLGRVWYSQHFSTAKQSSTSYCEGGNDAGTPYNTILGWTEALQTFPIGVIDVKADCSVDSTTDKNYKVVLTFGSQQTGRQEQIRVLTNTILGKEEPYIVGYSSASGYHGMREKDLELCRFSEDGIAANDQIDTCETYELTGKTKLDECPDFTNTQLATNEYCVAYTILSGGKDDFTYIYSDSLPPLPCSNNGICDQSTGLCNCFTGFYGLACTEQSALV